MSFELLHLRDVMFSVTTHILFAPQSSALPHFYLCLPISANSVFSSVNAPDRRASFTASGLPE